MEEWKWKQCVCQYPNKINININTHIMNLMQTFFNKKSTIEIKNPHYDLDIELYKVLDIDMSHLKILVKIYNQEKPIWLSVDSKSLSKLNYKLVSRAHLIDAHGIYVSSDILNKASIDPPKGKRRCYQCEFDQFIVENNLVDEAITNGLVWKTVSNYLIMLQKCKNRADNRYRYL
jgi:hypothetical protein